MEAVGGAPPREGDPWPGLLGHVWVAIAAAFEGQTPQSYYLRFFLSSSLPPPPLPFSSFSPSILSLLHSSFSRGRKTILTIYCKLGVLTVEHLIILITLQGIYIFYFTDEKMEIQNLLLFFFTNIPQLLKVSGLHTSPSRLNSLCHCPILHLPGVTWSQDRFVRAYH